MLLVPGEQSCIYADMLLSPLCLPLLMQGLPECTLLPEVSAQGMWDHGTWHEWWGCRKFIGSWVEPLLTEIVALQGGKKKKNNWCPVGAWFIEGDLYIYMKRSNLEEQGNRNYICLCLAFIFCVVTFSEMSSSLLLFSDRLAKLKQDIDTKLIFCFSFWNEPCCGGVYLSTLVWPGPLCSRFGKLWSGWNTYCVELLQWNLIKRFVCLFVCFLYSPSSSISLFSLTWHCFPKLLYKIRNKNNTGKVGRELLNSMSDKSSSQINK